MGVNLWELFTIRGYNRIIEFDVINERIGVESSQRKVA
jgi:hypothetical protein